MIIVPWTGSKLREQADTHCGYMDLQQRFTCALVCCDWARAAAVAYMMCGVLNCITTRHIDQSNNVPECTQKCRLVHFDLNFGTSFNW